MLGFFASHKVFFDTSLPGFESMKETYLGRYCDKQTYHKTNECQDAEKLA